MVVEDVAGGKCAAKSEILALRPPPRSFTRLRLCGYCSEDRSRPLCSFALPLYLPVLISNYFPAATSLPADEFDDETSIGINMCKSEFDNATIERLIE